MPKIPIDLKDGKIKNVEKIYGIDLGTTHSLVAKIEDGQAQIITDAEGKNSLVPSIVHLSSAGELMVGPEAKKRLIQEPERTIYSAKRLLGRSYGDLEKIKDHLAYEIHPGSQEDDLVKIEIEGKFYSPIEISAEILKHLKARVENREGSTMNRVVITVPAYFNDAQRQATRDAGKLAGMDVMRIVNEPTAAALAYGIGLTDKDSRTVAVYDLGGGTFDLTILEITAGVFEVLSTRGDTALGGDDIDRAIVHLWEEKYDLSSENAGSLRLLAEKAKKQLGKDSFFSEIHSDQELTLSQEEYETILEPIVQKTLINCQKALKDADLSTDQIDRVILVGGSTRIPYIKEKLQAFFGKKPDDDLDPDKAVALGAAIQADILAGNNKDMLLIDVTPLSLGIETMGRLMDVIIPRNTKIPYKAKRQYTTSKDGQVNLKVAVYQGERDSVVDNRKLGEFILSDIPPMPAGIPKIEITFLIDADGILQVNAKELRSEVEQSVRIRPAYGLSEEEMAQMLMDSIQNAEEDIAYRKKQEAINECDNIINATEKFIQQNEDQLQQTEVALLKESIEKLKESKETDADAIEAAIKQHDMETRPIAERIMDSTISASLQGKQL